MKRFYLLTAMLPMAMATFAQKSPFIQAVDEYRPAPGQFVNVLPELTAADNAETAAKKCSESIAGRRNGYSVTLGAYGGYITFHFDHSVINVAGEPDLRIYGNAHPGSSEAGIVMVSKDENGNGKPDDIWYELSGSADVDSVGKVIYDYEITYKPNPMNDIPWTDNKGKTGTVERIVLEEYPREQEYYPLWIKEDLTFKGTLLPKNSYTNKDGWWLQNSFRYGYVDNVSNSDKPDFDIDNAVDANRNAVKLDKIDFVRVYNGLNDKCPRRNWVGELSTEVSGAEDLHPTATNIDAPLNSNSETMVKAIFTIDGKEVKELQRGINIVKFENGKVKKVIVK